MAGRLSFRFQKHLGDQSVESWILSMSRRLSRAQASDPVVGSLSPGLKEETKELGMSWSRETSAS